MMKKTEKTAGIFMAVNLVGFGVACFLQTELGGDSIAVFCEGLQRTLGTSFGTASLIFNLFFVLTALVVSRSDLGAGTAVYALASGYFIDLYAWLLGHMRIEAMALPVRLLWYLAGICMFSAGLAVLIRYRLGMSAMDAVIKRISASTGRSYRAIRTIFDLLCVGGGFILGGRVGIGTLLCAVLTGSMVKTFEQIHLKSDFKEEAKHEYTA